MNRWLKHFVSLLVIAGICLSFTGIACAVSPEEKQKIIAAVPDQAKATPKQARKLLVFTLCKGYVHSSIPYAVEALKAMADKTEAFTVVVSNDVVMFKAQNLKPFDAVCFDNTTGELFDDPALKKNLMDFIKGGKGIVGIHAATDCFYKWPEFGEMMGGYFDGHPWVSSGTWAVKIDDPRHPLMAAFGGKGFKINDEIYRIKAPYSRENLRVLMSLDMTDETNLKARGIRPTDTDVGISWVRDYGKGRLFYCSLGHNNHIFWNPAILQYYLDGIQFALGDMKIDTTPSAKLSNKYQNQAQATAQQAQWDAALDKIKSYKFGQSREPLTVVADMVRDSATHPDHRHALAQRLATLLQSDATFDCKQFLCRQLSLIGTEKQVPVLAKLLLDEKMSDMARYALERIPAGQVDQTLRQALGKTSGRIKVGIINSLGNRADTKALDPLIDLLDDKDQKIAGAAVGALSKIGSKKAAQALDQALDKSEGQIRLAVADAYLLCADKFLAAGRNKAATQIYEQMYAEDEPQRIRTAALGGLVATGSDQGVSFILAALRSENPAQRGMAARLVREIPGEAGTKAFARQLPQMDPAGQIQLLSALADRGDKAALPEVVKATQSNDESVRLTALKTVGILGDAANVKMLAQRATDNKGSERETARHSLDILRGKNVNNKMLTLIQSDAQLRSELIRSLAARHATEAVPTLIKTTSNKDRIVRTASWKALRMLGGANDIATLVEQLAQADKSDRKEAEQTVVMVTRRIARGNQRTAAVLAQLNQTDDTEIKSSLLRVLGAIGESKSLPVLRAALRNKNESVRDAAIRGLSSWPTAEPIADLMEVAQSSENQVHRVLALRGFIDMIGKSRQQTSTEKLNMYHTAMRLAKDTAQKKKVLAGIATLATPNALQTAQKYLAHDDLKAEAALATAQIAKSIYVTHPDQTKAALTQAMNSVSNASIQKQCRDVLQLIERVGAYITQWQVSGPYTQTGKNVNQLFDIPFAPENAPAQAQWKTISMGTDPQRPWLINIKKALGGDNRVAYLRTAVWSPTDQQVNLLLGSDDGAKVWLNDKIILQQNVTRAFTPDQDKIKVNLQSGWNLLILKVTQGTGGWEASARFLGLDGNQVKGLKVDITAIEKKTK